jgi:NTE family protein
MGRKLRLGIALGGGAARGIAHIGVLRALEEEGIPIYLITGTSMGALIGAIYAWQSSTEKVIEIIKNMIESRRFKEISPYYFDEEIRGYGFYHRFFHLFKKSIVFAKSIAQKSLIAEKDYRSLIHEIFGELRIEDLKLPFGCVATDLASGKGILITKGSLTDAICASCAIPGVLPPIKIEGLEMIDGGIVENIPVPSAKRMGADLIIGVNVSKDVEEIEGFFNLENAIDIVLRAHDAARNCIDEIMIDMAHIPIRPSVGDIHWADFSAFEECIIRGEKETRGKIPLIRRLLFPRIWNMAFWMPKAKSKDIKNSTSPESVCKVKSSWKIPKIGLSISGSTSQVFIQMGILKAMEDRGIRIDALTATGIGAILGAVYLMCRDWKEFEMRIRELIKSDTFRAITMEIPVDVEQYEGRGFFSTLKQYLKKRAYYALSLTRRSFISMKDYENAIEEIFPDITIEDLPIAFGCVALDLISGRDFIINRGSLRKAIMATSARPGISPPIEWNGMLLVDGSWISGVPVKLARHLGADVVIASYIELDAGERRRLDCALDIGVRGIELTRKAVDDLRIREADIILRPKSPPHFNGEMELDPLIEAGENTFKAIAEQIERLVRKKKWKLALSSILWRAKG